MCIDGLWLVIGIFWIRRHMFEFETKTPKSIQSTEPVL